MKQMRTISLELRFILTTIAGMTLVLGSLGLFQAFSTQSKGIADLEAFADSAVNKLAINLGASLWNMSTESAEVAISSEMNNSSIVATVVTGTDSTKPFLVMGLEKGAAVQLA